MGGLGESIEKWKFMTKIYFQKMLGEFLKSCKNNICWWKSWCNVKQHEVNCRAVGSSPKYIRKKPARRIQKNLKNIIFYSCYESSKTGKCNAFLVSFIIPLSWPEWFTSCFMTWCKIFLKITHQTALREAWPNTAPFFFQNRS